MSQTLKDFRIMDSGPSGAAFNMALDEALAISARQSGAPAVIRFYGWEKPALSIGRFQKNRGGFDMDFIRASGLPVVVRPTGGRAVLHLENELTYSLSSRFAGVFEGKGLFECYALISSVISGALERLGAGVETRSKRKDGPRSHGNGPDQKNAHCFQSVSYSEITFRGKKLVGSAQRRWRDGFLQQGSILFEINERLQSRVFRGFDRRSMIGLNEIVPGDEKRKREDLKRLLAEGFGELTGFPLPLVAARPDQRELALARDLLPAYEAACF